MVNQQLVDYIKTNKSKGYSEQTLKQFLISRGHSSSDIDNAISAAGGGFSAHKFIWIGGGLLLLIIIALGIFILIPGETESFLISVIPQESRVKFGDNIVYDILITNTGTRQFYDVRLSYEVLYAGRSIDSGFQTINSETKKISFTTPSIELGTYEIIVDLDFGEVISSRSTVFVEPKCGDNICQEGEECIADCGIGGQEEPELPEIVEEIPIIEDVEEIPEEPTLCGNRQCDLTEDFITCPDDCPAPVCGDNVCDFGETRVSCAEDCEFSEDITKMTQFQMKKYIANVAEERGGKIASDECEKLSSINKDECLNQIAKTTNSHIYCNLIEGIEKRDDCYINYSYETKDFSVCNELIDEFKKQVCDSLQRANEQ